MWLELVSPLWAPGLAVALVMPVIAIATAALVVVQSYRRLDHNSHCIDRIVFDYRTLGGHHSQIDVPSSIPDWFWPDFPLVATALRVA